jgi:hypothetical protein
MVDERAECRRSDIFASDKAQPRQPLRIGQQNAARLDRH